MYLKAKQGWKKVVWELNTYNDVLRAQLIQDLTVTDFLH